MALRSTAVLAALAFTGTLALGLTTRGPFHFTIPVVGLTAEQLPELRETLLQGFGHEIVDISTKGDLLEFFAGGESPKSLLHLGELTAAIGRAGLKVDPDHWHVKPQALGVCLSTPDAIGQVELQKTLESLKCVRIKVRGSLLCGKRLCLVLDLEAGVDYATLRDELRVKQLQLDDLIWGHWKQGWGIASEDGGSGHELGIISRKKKRTQ